MFYPSSPTPTPYASLPTGTATGSATPSVLTASSGTSSTIPSAVSSADAASATYKSARMPDLSADEPDPEFGSSSASQPGTKLPNTSDSPSPLIPVPSKRCPRGTRRNKKTGECKAHKPRKSSKASPAVANMFSLAPATTMKGRVAALEDGYNRLAAKVSTL